jgi:ubiquitin C-terminal hydrolase
MPIWSNWIVWARIYWGLLVYATQGAGLHNLGNTCYLNSVLQCLTYTEPFVAYLQNGKHKSSCKFSATCNQPIDIPHVRMVLPADSVLENSLFSDNI